MIGLGIIFAILAIGTLYNRWHVDEGQYLQEILASVLFWFAVICGIAGAIRGG